MQRLFYIATVFFFLGLVPLAHGAGEGEIESEFRCGTQIVSRMDQTFQVLQKCGEPKSKEKTSGTEGPLMEKWIYESFGGYYYVLTFRDDALIEIVELPGDE